MASDYPATFDVSRPEKFERPQVILRVVLLVVLSLLAGALGWIVSLVYLAVPVISAVFISQKGSQRFLDEDGPRITGWLRWLVAVDAYIAMLTDRFPTERPEDAVRFGIRPSGAPTVGSALLRLIYSIPSAFVLSLLSFVSAIVWLIAAVMVLLNETYSEGLYDFQRGVVRWGARLLAYHASLVDTYPPFSLDTGPESAPAIASEAPSA